MDMIEKIKLIYKRIFEYLDTPLVSKYPIVNIVLIPNLIKNGESLAAVLTNHESNETLSEGVIKAFGWDSKKIAIFIANNNEMKPIINTGTKVIVDLSLTNIVDNKFYVVKIGNNIKINRIIKSKDSNYFIMKAHSNEFSDSFKEITLNRDYFDVIGKVVMLKDAFI